MDAQAFDEERPLLWNISHRPIQRRRYHGLDPVSMTSNWDWAAYTSSESSSWSSSSPVEHRAYQVRVVYRRRWAGAKPSIERKRCANDINLPAQVEVVVGQSLCRKFEIDDEYRSDLDLLGGGNGGAVGMFPCTFELLVGAPGGADEMDDVELFGEPRQQRTQAHSNCPKERSSFSDKTNRTRVSAVFIGWKRDSSHEIFRRTWFVVASP